GPRRDFDRWRAWSQSRPVSLGRAGPVVSWTLVVEAVADLDQELVAVAQLEGVAHQVEGVVAVLVEDVAAAAVDDVQVGQRRQLVAITDLEAELAEAEVVDRLA